MTETIRTIELSIGENYVSDWGVWEAVREIIQNAQDSVDDLDKVHIESCSSNVNKNNTLSISNKTDNPLDISSLVLGNSVKDKPSSLGKYGEGYKLALLVLIRNNVAVTIYNHTEVWKPRIAFSDNYNSKVLVIDIYNKPSYAVSNYVEFVLVGLSDIQLDELKAKSLLSNQRLGSAQLETINTHYGSIINDYRYSGMFYVNGLFVCNDENFRFGYDFKSKYVSLDRDRKAINLYSLYELTAKSLLSQKIGEVDYNVFYKAITTDKDDGRYIRYNIGVDQNKFNIGFANYFINKNNIDIEETFICTKDESKYISNYESNFITSSLIAKIVNMGLGRYNEYVNIINKAKISRNKDNQREHYESSSLYNLHQWVINNQDSIDSEELNKLVDIIAHIYVEDLKETREEIEQEFHNTLNMNRDKKE